MKTAAAFALALSTLGLAACGPSSEPMASEMAGRVVVDMTPSLTFTPETVTISAGESVTFRNVSGFAHTVSTTPATPAQAASVSLPEGAMAFDSGSIAAGGTFTQTFTVPGTYRYFCDPHHGAEMVGTIVVTAS
ncbi:cupredoxin domain-containing protein [Pontivivens insulae]|uniref:Plastocyanin n=1 Tax=Pontivivens insulae TaxID=1639689 RepID=A0A2R8A813_9RHOB|nr:plastocyanin/azurin family copper-binding protein [Pontivivens insulae]RED18438.1 plastocyanin [Pontivivens insulae]SPF28336.1 Plastocyanin [Pontivivens insulae]